MKKKRHLKYIPCKCPVWKFPHKPEDRCYERFEDFDLMKHRQRQIEYADANGGSIPDNFDQRADTRYYRQW